LVANDNVTEVALVGGDIDVIKVDGHASELDATGTSVVAAAHFSKS
jgi:hypothetical protein